jgi:hypothetical protein
MPIILTLPYRIRTDLIIDFIVQFYGASDTTQKNWFFDASRCLKNETGKYAILQVIATLQDQDIRQVTATEEYKNSLLHYEERPFVLKSYARLMHNWS